MHSAGRKDKSFTPEDREKLRLAGFGWIAPSVYIPCNPTVQDKSQHARDRYPRSEYPFSDELCTFMDRHPEFERSLKLVNRWRFLFVTEIVISKQPPGAFSVTCAGPSDGYLLALDPATGEILATMLLSGSGSD